MRVLVAGATGVIGRQLLPLLIQAGHDVVALARTPMRPDMGYDVVLADALDRKATASAVDKAEPDAVVHLLTAIPKQLNPKRLASEFAVTNRLRTEGTANLVDAARAAGDTRVIAQGLAYAYRPSGAQPADEDTAFWTDGPKQFRPVVEALIEHERITRDADGLVLRFGHLYGPGSAYAPDGHFTRQVRAGKVPIVGGGDSVFSFTHARDAATAVVAALASPLTGALNIVDDNPTPIRTWLPEMAALLGSAAPKKAPAWLARTAVGSWGVAFMTSLSGADNARARAQLGWSPDYPSWQQGFTAGLADRG
ncbi:NAD-dependent epimerase/dehydratase family protein [Phytoactinopolyspora halotolerans]|uniref:NAD(P)-dependent oxidoreductase n=1 Tax=Phytoactinopolyspora halotolerans TaxID=1981512 RepID=A0A6L9S248_9ACTN|nr:NAD(P)-dependent oxidoreductase [Phytoactinopolyspora halotolerans]NED99152.1 NAD(P)-dependent oxidoreductase [Phytoactinopolyspora halotolerans]